ncbi:Abi family protein [Cellulomonas marina]|uniref:Abortive infection bacteriophage resistance protein n=1 Tax=Cellulomonas marina TaxID=988821 RepID=A0A1I1A5G9_9CELL|nr:Abi family protein [Cellulomonas marina]GIG29575.1 peptide ABC transporter substrate-binding protein [Cellulomonas marina]SFB33274.1 Abortive infection bacteriophage resistance protein [Cellulomonas marina]
MVNRAPRPRGTSRYTKPALTHDLLVERLRSRGLVVPDQDRALRYLQAIGYYRLSPYLIPFQVRQGDHTLRPGTSFDDVLRLYVFDRRLRLLVMDGLERVEVAVRANLTDTMALIGGPHWYVEPQWFSATKEHEGLLAAVRRQCDDQSGRRAETPSDVVVHPSALEHYLTHYGEPELPPSWVMVELLTIGQLERVVRNLRERAHRTAVAAGLGIKEPLLASWLRTFTRVRNVCAHHGRLWNVGLGVYPKLPAARDVAWLHDRDELSAHPERAQRLYPALVAIQSVLSTVSPGSSWSSRLVELVREHPEVPLQGMGMFEGWAADPFWTSGRTG